MERSIEEHALAVAEMDWIPRGYRNKANWWFGFQGTLGAGHDVYASKQGSMWEAFELHARKQFAAIREAMRV